MYVDDKKDIDMKKQITLVGDKEAFINKLLDAGYTFEVDTNDYMKKHSVGDSLGLNPLTVGVVVNIETKVILGLMHRRLNSMASFETLLSTEFSRRYNV